MQSELTSAEQKHLSMLEEELSNESIWGFSEDDAIQYPQWQELEATRIARVDALRFAVELIKQIPSSRAERDGLLALVERWREQLMGLTLELDSAAYGITFGSQEDCREFTGPRLFKATNEMFNALSFNPAQSLADLKARVRREALEEAANHLDGKAKAFKVSKDTTCEIIYQLLMDLAAELRRMAGEASNE